MVGRATYALLALRDFVRWNGKELFRERCSSPTNPCLHRALLRLILAAQQSCVCSHWTTANTKAQTLYPRPYTLLFDHRIRHQCRLHSFPHKVHTHNRRPRQNRRYHPRDACGLSRINWRSSTSIQRRQRLAQK
jgi:hypothetical protein